MFTAALEVDLCGSNTPHLFFFFKQVHGLWKGSVMANCWVASCKTKLKQLQEGQE